MHRWLRPTRTAMLHKLWLLLLVLIASSLLAMATSRRVIPTRWFRTIIAPAVALRRMCARRLTPATAYPEVPAALLKAAYSPADIGKVWRGNAVRVLREARALADPAAVPKVPVKG